MLYARALLTPVSVDNRIGIKTPKEHEKQSIHKQSHSDEQRICDCTLSLLGSFSFRISYQSCWQHNVVRMNKRKPRLCDLDYTESGKTHILFFCLKGRQHEDEHNSSKTPGSLRFISGPTWTRSSTLAMGTKTKQNTGSSYNWRLQRKKLGKHLREKVTS